MTNSSVELFTQLGTSGVLQNKHLPIIIADNIRTPENMGLILRLAGNISASKTLFLNDITPNFKEYKIKRTSSGSADKVNWDIIKPAALTNHLPDDYKIVAFETSKDSSNIFSFKFPEKTAFLVGNEVTGISEKILSMAHHEVYIPIPGLISSLNVTHALSVGLFEWLRQNT